MGLLTAVDILAPANAGDSGGAVSELVDQSLVGCRYFVLATVPSLALILGPEARFARGVILTDSAVLNTAQHTALVGYIGASTIPLLSDSGQIPEILGTGTLLTHEDRHFIVTAAHILKTDADDLSSADRDLSSIAYPTGRSAAQLLTLGPITVYRPAPPSRVDVVVLELRDTETVKVIGRNWIFLTLQATGSLPFNARFVLSGYPLEGTRWDGRDVGQSFLTLTTDPLHYVPEVQYPEPTVDRFFYLQDEGELLDGSTRKIPKLQGLSGASLWAYTEPSPSELWTPQKTLRIVGVQSSYSRGKWFRCTDWEAVRVVLRDSEVGLRSPP